VLRPLVPRELTLDTFEGRAFVGLVPFAMQGVRPRWAPAVPGVSTFLETNVRTYVHHEGAEPGVWFFSLDAASRVAVELARMLFHLPYWKAAMRMRRDADVVEYHSRRARASGRQEHASTDVRWVVKEPIGDATPGTLEHFLAERYVLYATDRASALWLGRVHHSPYPLHRARVERIEESLLAAAVIPRTGEPASVLYSPGVDVEVFALQPAGTA
jgi:uncharacterized protein YqjF (DUF2071 family)